jgi:hypothetical protein
MNLILIDKRDEFGNDGVVLHSLSKEERAAGQKGEIAGNWRRLGGSKRMAKERAPKQASST